MPDHNLTGCFATSADSRMIMHGFCCLLARVMILILNNSEVCLSFADHLTLMRAGCSNQVTRARRKARGFQPIPITCKQATRQSLVVQGAAYPIAWLDCQALLKQMQHCAQHARSTRLPGSPRPQLMRTTRHLIHGTPFPQHQLLLLMSPPSRPVLAHHHTPALQLHDQYERQHPVQEHPWRLKS